MFDDTFEKGKLVHIEEEGYAITEYHLWTYLISETRLQNVLLSFPLNGLSG